VATTDRLGALIETVSTLFYSLFVAASVITLIMAVLERTQARLHLFEKWDLRSLPPAPKQAQPPSRTQTIFELISGILGLLWLLALPQYPFLILGPAAAFLKPAPMWHNFYLPMILLALAGLAYQGVSLMRPQWTWLPPTARLFNTLLGLVIVNYMIAAAATPNGEWHPYVVVANWVQASAQLNRVAAIVNLSVLLTLACVWFGFCIAGLIQTWQLVCYFRKRAFHARDPALLRTI